MWLYVPQACIDLIQQQIFEQGGTIKEIITVYCVMVASNLSGQSLDYIAPLHMLSLQGLSGIDIKLAHIPRHSISSHPHFETSFDRLFGHILLHR